MYIKEVKAHVIKNSRGEDAIEVLINKKYKGSAPSGASTGIHEVPCFSPQGILASVSFLNTHAHLPGLKIEEFSDLALFDPWISEIGGNAVLALQSACLQALSEGDIAPYLSSSLKFPIPLGNCIGGGAHTHLKSIDIQEFLLLPQAKTFSERVFLNRHVYHVIEKLTAAKKKTDEGAFILKQNDEETFSFLSALLDDLRSCGFSLRFGIDMASSQFYDKGKYHYKHFSLASPKKVFSPKQQIAQVNTWIKKYDLAYIEDPLFEEDFFGFSQIHKKNTLLCGDDLVATNIERLKEALKQNSINSIIVKPNQIGSLVRTKEIVDFCRKKGIRTVISHRSGETMDPLIAHLAAAWHIPYIKTGIFGKEREIKLQELIRLEKCF